MSRDRLSRRELLAGVSLAAVGACTPVRAEAPGPASRREPPTPRRLPRWRGFNLWEKVTRDVDAPYLEWDFDRIAEWGFDFVRLPADYRIWTSPSGGFREAPLREIDRAIAWGKARGIHVCVALSFAPGYGVNAPKSPPDAGALDLWGDGATGDEARRQFAAQWRMLAERYRGTDSAHLSFNLVNEPPRISGARYLRTARAAVDAIRAVDAGRLVIADGASWGREPVPELGSLGVAQSTRGYAPFQLSHYAADWMERSTEWPEPVWPIPPSLNAHVYGPWKREWHRPLVLRGNFEPGPLAITVQHVSARAVLVLSADGVEVLRHAFVPGPGVGAWRHSEYVAEYGIHAATYGTRHVATLTKPAREIRVEVVDGDWLSFSELRIGTRTFAAHDLTWGVPQGDYTVDPSGAPTGMSERGRTEAATLFARHVEPWARFARDARVGVHVGEWGVYRETPHDVALSWMRDCLDNWRRVGFGWALWNLRGPFGVCDSERKDVSYEPYAGHRLDRRMLEVLVADTPS